MHLDAASDALESLTPITFVSGLCVVSIAVSLHPSFNKHLRHFLERLSSIFHTQLQRILYLIAAPRILEDAYRKTPDGSPFTVHTPSNDHVMVSSEQHAKELADAPYQQLSLHAIAKELLQPKYTMHGFEWQDQRGVEGTGFVRALRSLLLSHLPELLPDIQESVERSLADGLEKHRGVDGESHVKIFRFVKEVISKANCVMFFGKELSQNQEFTDAAIQYPQDVIFAAEILRVTPVPLRPLVAYLTTRGHRATSTLYRILEPHVQARLDMRNAELDGQARDTKKYNDCMQWLIETSPRKNPWSCRRMIGEIMAIWFGSVHQLAMTTTYAIHDLCDHPEVFELLRQEATTLFESRSYETFDRMPLLESFIMESARTSCSDAVSVRRKALQNFSFSDGVEIKAGNWGCMPQMAMMRDSRYYASPDTFDVFRFISKASSSTSRTSDTCDDDSTSSTQSYNTAKFTDVNHRWLIWGLGNTACPGRFYASVVLKLILVEILLKYECRRPGGKESRSRSWRSSVVPKTEAVVALRQRG